MQTKICTTFLFSLLTSLSSTQARGENQPSQASTPRVHPQTVVYYALIDRFADGSTGNNFAPSGDPDAARHWPNTAEFGFPGQHIGNLSYDYRLLGEPTQSSEWKKFWGGDLQGLRSHIPYLKDLGLGTLYISSPVKQSDAMPYAIDAQGRKQAYTAYHGFWPKDLYRIDEHFAGPTRWESTPPGEKGGAEGWKIFDQLAQAVADAGMNLMVDAVVNHTNPRGLGEGFFDPSTSKNYPPGSAGWGENGALYKDRNFIASAGPFYVNQKLQDFRDDNWFYNHMGSSNEAVNSSAFAGFGWSGLGDYNFTLKGSFAQPASWNGWRTAAFDNPSPYEYVRGALERFIDHGVQAFRLDATKHVELSYLRRLAADLQAYSREKYGRSLYLLGEWFGSGFPAESFGGTNHISDKGNLQPYGSFADYYYADPTANIDFQLAWKIQACLGQDRSLKVLAEYLQSKNAFFSRDDQAERSHWQMIAFENHDMPRFMQVARHYGSENDEFTARRRHILASVFLLTSDGIPMLYYGSEIFLYKDNPDKTNDQDPWNRPMMPNNFPYLAQRDPLIAEQQHNMRVLSQLRAEGTALAFGETHVNWVDDDVLCFQRVHDQETVQVCLNRSPEARTITGLESRLPDGQYFDLLHPVQIQELENGQFRPFILPAWSALVLKGPQR